jgi:hypothetical protein
LRGDTRQPSPRHARGGLAALLLLAGLAAPAAADSSVGRFFAHEDVFAPDTGFGVAESEKQARAFGVPVFVNQSLFYAGSEQAILANGGSDVAGTARLFSLRGSFDFDVLLNDVDADAGTAHASYTLTLPADFLDERQSELEQVFLFFATSRDVLVDGSLVSYASPDVGIGIDSADPRFALLHTRAQDLDLFYPAVRLPQGGVGDSFELDVSVLGGLEVVRGTSVVPDFLVGAAYVTVVPEPATAALLALGVAGLAVLGSRYSV